MNKFDKAYQLGYAHGYHGEAYDNQHDEDKQPQYNVKYKHGWIDGFVFKQEEREAQYA